MTAPTGTELVCQSLNLGIHARCVFVGWLFFHGESAAIRSKRTLSELDFVSPRASSLNRPNQCPPPPVSPARPSRRG